MYRLKFFCAYALVGLVVLWHLFDAFFLLTTVGVQAVFVTHDRGGFCYWVPSVKLHETYSVSDNGDTYGLFWTDDSLVDSCVIDGSRFYAPFVGREPGVGLVSVDGSMNQFRVDSALLQDDQSIYYVGPAGPLTFSLGRLHYALFTANRLWQRFIGDAVIDF